jgi:hypothetical protein
VLLLIHLAATLFMTGLIWFVQVVHYPLFARVGGDFVAYQQAHMQQTTWVVGPVMLLEAITAAALLVHRPVWISSAAVWANLALLALIWASTALLQVPQHEKLLAGFAAGPHAVLVGGNWLRTIPWTLRSVGLLVLVEQAIRRLALEGI